MFELAVGSEFKRCFRSCEQHKKRHKCKELNRIGIAAHEKNPVAGMIVYFNCTLLSHGNGFFMKDQSFCLIIDFITCLYNTGAPVPLFIINKEFFREHTNRRYYFTLYHHGTAMSAMGIARS